MPSTYRSSYVTGLSGLPRMSCALPSAARVRAITEIARGAAMSRCCSVAVSSSLSQLQAARLCSILCWKVKLNSQLIHRIFRKNRSQFSERNFTMLLLRYIMGLGGGAKVCARDREGETDITCGYM